MSAIGTVVKTYMGGDSSITDIVGSGADMMIFQHVIPQTVRPGDRFIRYEDFGGRSMTDDCLEGDQWLFESRLQIDCYGSTPAEASALMALVRARLMPSGAFKGLMGSTLIDSIDVADVPRDGVDPPKDGSATYRFWESMDFYIRHHVA